MVGKQLNHYEIVRKLGEGGMGEVFVARDTKLNREVALKVLPPELAEDPDRLERFEREATTVAALNHPNIVTIYSVEEAAGLRFMTMELIEGRTLDAFIPKDGMAPREFLELAIPLADAIATAHDRGVQHRDLKPANVMVTDEGRVKVLDFGLAKIQQSVSGPEGMTQMQTGALTGEGKILGTVAYMSPEQAEGRSLDHRSDIFSLGILLFEMITGDRPFKGDTNLSVLSSILKDDPTSVSDINRAVPIPVARVIKRALAKRPSERYQSVSDLRQDLLDVKRDMDTGEALESGLYSGVHQAPEIGSRPAWASPGILAGAAAIALLAVVGFAALNAYRSTGSDGPARSGVVPVAAGAPAVAVFYFDNRSNDTDLQWLRTGLADMFVTDLSQSPQLRVLGTDRLYSMLEELGRLEDETTSFETVQSVASAAGMNTAVVGGFARVGDQVRIDARVQDARTGDVLASESVSGTTDEIFSLVDDLSSRITDSFDVPEMSPEKSSAMADAGMGDRDLGAVTTRNVNAYRLYNEGVNLNMQSKEDLAIPLLEEAVEMDPEFAMAFAKLSVAYGNEGNQQKAREYAKRAFDLADKLPPRERFYIQGRYYSLSPDTIEDSIAAYSRTLELFPDDFPARNNVAIELIELERFDEGIDHLEELRRRGHRFAGTFNTLANAYAITGRYSEAVEVLRDYTEANPDNAEGFNNLAVELTRAGRYDEALEALDRAQSIRPDPRRLGFEGGIHVLSGDLDAADASVDELEASGGEMAAFEALGLRSDLLLYRGQAEGARAALAQAVDMVPRGTPRWFATMDQRVDLEQLIGEPSSVLELTATMRDAGFDPSFAQNLLIAEAIAHAGLGDEDGVSDRRREILEILGNLPLAPKTRRRIDYQLDGIMAFARRDYEEAAGNLEQALRLLRARDISEEGLALRYFLALSLWETGDRAQTVPHLEAIRDATLSRARQPVIWVRSLWYLGAAFADSGNDAEARRHYRQFLDYWGDGELDRENADIARAYLQGAPR